MNKNLKQFKLTFRVVGTSTVLHADIEARDRNSAIEKLKELHNNEEIVILWNQVYCIHD